jgi:hypothetical protein
VWNNDDWNSAEYVTGFLIPEKVQNYCIPKKILACGQAMSNSAVTIQTTSLRKELNFFAVF